jgi:FMN-dependent NADH-azoreductase
MCDIIHISSSQLGSASYSRQIAEHVIRDLGKDASFTVRDLERVPLPHVDDDFVTATSLGLKSSPQSTDGGRMEVHNHSVWRKVLGAVLEPRTLTNENGMIEYLNCHRHDLPPAVLD